MTVELPPLQEGLTVGWETGLAPALGVPGGAEEDVLAGVVLAVGVLDHGTGGHAEAGHGLEKINC